MKRKLLISVTFLFVIMLTGCLGFGNYKEGYKKYSRTIDSYDLYYQELDMDAECPKEANYLYTLYTSDGNTYKYEGIRTGDGCYVPLYVDSGSRFVTIDTMLDDNKITASQLEDVSWTFNFVIEQTPDYTVGTIDFIEYFQEVGDYDIYVIDYGDMICHDLSSVLLFEYSGAEYYVEGSPSGDGCVSGYYIYYVEEVEDDGTHQSDTNTDTDEDGTLTTINDALQLGYITLGDVARSEYESELKKMYIEEAILATEATIFFVDDMKEYNTSNPYVLDEDERTEILKVLAANKYYYNTINPEEDESYMILTDFSELEHRYSLFGLEEDMNETVIAILELQDAVGNDYIYEIYPSGMRLVRGDLDVFADFQNQTYIITLLETLDE